jgi:chemotaxis protein methyltransferase CheR
MALTLSPQVFTILSALVEERCGLHYDEADRELLAHKVAPRALEAGFESMLDYYYFMRYDPAGPAELDALVNALVVGETYFFREADQLEVLVSEILEPRLRAGGRPRVWSAACSTGEEPLTLAMMLAGRRLLDDVRIVATDISARSLDRARRGLFGRRSIRSQPPPGYALPYLELAGDEVRVAPGLIERIDWLRVNLMSDQEVAAIPEADVILCRNVLIYFTDDVAHKVVRRLSARLAHGGTLFVGVSESLLRYGTALACEERHGVFFYRKVAA